MVQITYERLFAYLERLGFHDASPSAFERVFENADDGTLLAFAMQDDASTDRTVRAADVLSVQFRLQQIGLLSGPLLEAIPRFSEI